MIQSEGVSPIVSCVEPRLKLVSGMGADTVAVSGRLDVEVVICNRGSD